MNIFMVGSTIGIVFFTVACFLFIWSYVRTKTVACQQCANCDNEIPGVRRMSTLSDTEAVFVERPQHSFIVPGSPTAAIPARLERAERRRSASRDEQAVTIFVPDDVESLVSVRTDDSASTVDAKPIRLLESRSQERNRHTRIHLIDHDREQQPQVRLQRSGSWGFGDPEVSDSSDLSSETDDDGHSSASDVEDTAAYTARTIQTIAEGSDDENNAWYRNATADDVATETPSGIQVQVGTAEELPEQTSDMTVSSTSRPMQNENIANERFLAVPGGNPVAFGRANSPTPSEDEESSVISASSGSDIASVMARVTDARADIRDIVAGEQDPRVARLLEATARLGGP